MIAVSKDSDIPGGPKFGAYQTLRLKVNDGSQRRWFPRTPAMAAGLTDHVWTIKELLTIVPLPNNNT